MWRGQFSPFRKLISAVGKRKIARHGCVNASGMRYRTVGKVLKVARNKIFEHSSCCYSTSYLQFSNVLRPEAFNVSIRNMSMRSVQSSYHGRSYENRREKAAKGYTTALTKSKRPPAHPLAVYTRFNILMNPAVNASTCSKSSA